MSSKQFIFTAHEFSVIYSLIYSLVELSKTKKLDFIYIYLLIIFCLKYILCNKYYAFNSTDLTSKRRRDGRKMQERVRPSENAHKGSTVSTLSALTASSNYVTWSGPLRFLRSTIQSCALQSVRESTGVASYTLLGPT